MDPVRTEVMRNRFAAIAEEASNVAYRTAYTTFVKQTQDYQVALASTDGEFFAYPMRAGVTSSVCQNLRGLVDEIGIDRLVPGDIILSNDPFSGDALCTHTMDIHLIRPVFRDGQVIALRLGVHPCIGYRRLGAREHFTDQLRSVPGRRAYPPEPAVPGMAN